jgi:hypothetical protein
MGAAGRLRRSQRRLASATEWVKAKGSELMLYLRHNDWRSGLRWAWVQMKAGWHSVFRPWTGAILLLAGTIIFILRRLRKARRPGLQPRHAFHPRLVGVENAPELALLLRRADQYWAAVGCERPPHRAPREHLASIPPDKIPAERRRASERLVESFYRASFGGVLLPPEEMMELRRESEALLSGPRAKA